MFEKELLLDFISDIQGNDHATATVLVLVIDETTNQEKIKFVNIVHTNQNDVRNKYITIINNKLVAFNHEEKEIKNIDDYDSSRNNYYYYFKSNQLTPEMMFLQNIGNIPELEHYNIQSNDKIKGIIIKIMTGNDEFDLFIPHYPYQQLSRDKNFFLMPSNDQFKIIDAEKILQFGHSPLLVSYHGNVLCFDFEKIETTYGYKEQLNIKASQKLQKIFDSGFIEDIVVLQALLAAEKSLRNKILKIKDDARIFTISLQRIKDFIVSKPRFSFQYSTSGKFNIINKNQAKNLLTVLNDDILKSELTDEEYEAEAKNVFNQR